ncbi:DeoR/GlpR family DNA-binding transcription regulator [Pseudaeromonas sp. ZJS20]|uniref:DeoR/GlpR family DNA-binding transcription regulator n=1 Tax=Pseudaeromonas aegiceratis TaxID=3153928 RepID=UPI00390CC475
MKLSKAERQKQIIAELQAQPTIRASELAVKFSVSTETIRRDLDEMEPQGLISRTYGGAARPLGPEPEIRERDRLFSRQRELIAKRMAGYIKHGDVLILGSGSTTNHLARRLAAEKHDLTLFTDSLTIASLVSPNPTISVNLLPGRYNDKECCVYGPETVLYLQKIYANHTIVGASGLAGEGLSNADLEIACTYQAMVTRAREVSVVADHSKFAHVAISVYSGWHGITRLVTDQHPADEELLSAIKLAGTEVVVARDEWGTSLQS